MKKIILALSVISGSLLYAQNYWKKAESTALSGKQQYNTYQLDLQSLRNYLAQSSTAKGSQATLVIPTLEGKLETFYIKSLPVVAPSLATRYQLESYYGVSTENPHRTVRFSVSPYNFQSMIMEGNKMQFIDPERTTKDLYIVKEKSNKIHSGKAFECTTNESVEEQNQIKALYKKASSQKLSNSYTPFSSDQKYRTLRLAVSVTGEYTQYFGGTAQALAQINATLTRVNGVFEKDMATHFTLVDAPQVIFDDPLTDPYSDADDGTGGAWTLELQNTLTRMVGDDNYDIGHLFGASGGGGNAGCIGCICTNPRVNAAGYVTGVGKGSAYTSPADEVPHGDTFDIDYVAHEIGHQMGANHTFSHGIENTGAQVEPGSGSTIMGYAGITYYNVQNNSDAYFSIASIRQMQNVLTSKSCDIETAVANTPPQIAALNQYTIPKGTAFVLSANVTDAENDPLTYTWEQENSATTAVTRVSPTRTNGANFRSIAPGESPTRYFPKLTHVMNGELTKVSDWETVSNVARTMQFTLTVRDNHPTVDQQQVGIASQTITVGADGPFVVKNRNTVYTDGSQAITWDVANTDQSPYNVANVKIDYTTDKGANWTTLAESTPNDGSENITLPTDLIGQNIQIRISAIDNVFYAVSTALTVADPEACSADAPRNLTGQYLNNEISLTWNKTKDATYIVNYRVKGNTDWTQANTSDASYQITGVDHGDTYEIQVAQVCNGTTSAFTSTIEVVVPDLEYCKLTAADSTMEYISNISIKDADGQALLNNTSTGNGYTDYFQDNSKIIALKKGSQSNQLSLQVTFPGGEDYYETFSAWIDFNGDGQLSEDERIIKDFIEDPSNDNVGTLTKTYTFNVPSDAVVNKSLRMRVALKVGPSINSAPASACEGNLVGAETSVNQFKYGEVEDYKVRISE